MANTFHDHEAHPKGGGNHPSIICQELIDIVQSCICRSFYKSQIKRTVAEYLNQPFKQEMLNEETGEMELCMVQFDPPREASPCTIEELCRLAREQMAEAVSIKHGLRSHLEESLAFYRNLISDPRTPVRDQLMARQRIDYLMTLEPERNSTKDTADGYQEKAERIRQQLAELERQTDGNT